MNNYSVNGYQLGVGRILAILVLIIGALSLLHVVPFDQVIIAACFVALSLALLL